MSSAQKWSPLRSASRSAPPNVNSMRIRIAKSTLVTGDRPRGVGGSASAIVGADQQDTVEVRLPGSVLAPSDYVLRRQGITGAAVEDLDAYVFRVLR